MSLSRQNEQGTESLDKWDGRRHDGAMTETAPAISALDRINLRLSGITFEAIDAVRAARPGRVSRNTWIAEAIEEKLAREFTNSGDALRKASNA